MKKNRDSSNLAARIAAAANQPAGAVTPVLVQSAPPVKPALAEQISVPERSRKTTAKGKAKEPIPITLRPSRELWNTFVLKAAERTREQGRVISAQQIMIETLERSIV